MQQTTTTIPTAALRWLQTGSKSTPALTLFGTLTGIWISEDRAHPTDPFDFTRCYDLIEAVPEWRKELPRMGEVSPEWAIVVQHWEELAGMLETMRSGQYGPKMYQFMKQLGL